MSDISNHCFSTIDRRYRLIEKLYEGTQTDVYRAYKIDEDSTKETPSQETVTIEIVKPSCSSTKILIRLYNQYSILQNFTIPRVIKVLALEPWGNTYALVREDVGAISLRDFLTNSVKRSLKQSLEIAIQLANILHDLNQHRLIHKDINPASILINPENDRVWLTNFGLASLLPKETQSIQPPNSLEGTLAYIAPEQTGRMNRSIDFRTDFYSLGATLYELFSERLPFPANDPIELIYNHLATIPTPPHRVNGEVPVQLSAIVMKLMAKNAEDRYQSASGIKYDLEKCLKQWQKNKHISKFELGIQDKSNRFIISEKLYGREAEVKILLDSFERVARGNTELMLVSGFSGIGKTALINEVHKPIAKQKGYFIQGKFEQFDRNIPFNGFVRAFNDLIKHLLAEPDRELALWKEKILEVLGENGQVIIEVVPELEKIIGKQPKATKLSASAAENRFNLLFKKFVRVFSLREHPLVIFLDDLQWADSASLNTIELLIKDLEQEYLLVLGAYRDNEVYATHPLMLTLKTIERSPANFNTIALKPLSLDSINNLVIDSLYCSKGEGKSLTEFIYRHTEGNPFFARQFLTGLYEEKCLKFDTEKKVWQYNLSQISNLQLSDDVVHFMVARLRRLPGATQDAIELAACIGDRFELSTLSKICDRSKLEISNNLWSALQAGLIVSETEIYRLYGEDEIINISEDRVIKYRFLHDRVQQAAYALIPEFEKEETHYQIGKFLSQNLAPEDIEANIFQIVNQLNLGRALVSQQLERDELARLNSIAGRKAKATTAYSTAVNYYQTGIALLGCDRWVENYDLTLSLYNGAAESAFLSSNYSLMERWLTEIFSRVSILQDLITAYEVKIQAQIAQNKLQESVITGLTILASLGIKYTLNPAQNKIQQEFAVTAVAIEERTPEDLLALPEMKATESISAIRILAAIWGSTFAISPALMPLIVLEMVKLSVRDGNTPLSSFAYVLYGVLLCGNEDFQAGYQFGELSLELLIHFDTQAFKAKILFLIGTHITIWKEPVRIALPNLQEGYQVGLATGDLEFAALSAAIYCYYSYLAGCSLSDVKQEFVVYTHAVEQINQSYYLNFLQIWHQAIANLSEGSGEPHLLIGQICNDAELLKTFKAKNVTTPIAYIYINRLMLNYLFGFYADAVEVSSLADEYAQMVPATLLIPIANFYGSLAKLALYSETVESVRDSVLDAIAQNQGKMKHWSAFAPSNYLHKYYLVEAEKNRILGNKLEALENYDRAIARARENEYIQEEALANELAAKFYLEWGKERVAAGYMQEAYCCYARWGAKAKTNHLEQNYPALLRPIPFQNCAFNPLETLSSFSSLISSDSQSQANFSLNNSFDLTAILKSAQALTSILEIDELLKKLSQIILQNAGCDRAIIALVDNTNTWQVNLVAEPEKIEFVAESLETDSHHPTRLINYVKNTQEIVLVDNLETDLPILDDYLLETQPQSLFALPLKYDEKTIGVLYLHSSYVRGLFNPERIIVLEFLCSQASIALHNAQLFADANLKSKVIESSVDGIAILDNGTFVYLNERHALLSGYQPEELIGQSWSKLYSPKEVDRLQKEIFPALEDTGEWSGEATALRKDGTTFAEEVRIFALDNGKLICICRDISDRKKLEQEQKRLIDILETTSDYIGFADRQGNVIWHNKPLRELRPDISIGEGKHKVASCHPQWVNEMFAKEAMPEAIRSNTWLGEAALLDEQGQEIPVSQVFIAHKNDEGEVEYFSTIMRDISDRKIAEQSLIKSENKFRTLVSNVHGAVYRCRHDPDWTIDFVSSAIEELSGYRANEFIQNRTRSFASIAHRDDYESIHQKVEEAIKNHHSFACEYRLVHRDGSIRWVLERGKGIYDDTGHFQHVEGVIFDISDRKIAEQSLIKSENKFRTLVSNVHGAVYRCRHDPDWTIDFVSSAIEELSGYRANEFIQNRTRSFASIAHRDDYESIHQKVEEAIKNHHSFAYEYRLVHRDGSIRWVLERGKGIYDQYDDFQHVEGVIFDISDRKANEKALEISALRDRTIFDRASVGFIEIDVKTQKLTRANDLFCQMTGYSVAELSQMKFQELTNPEDLENCLELFQQLISGETDKFFTEKRFLNKNGHYFWCETTAYPIEYEDDAVKTIFAIIKDISDRKKLEQQQKQLNAILEATSDYIGICNPQGNTIWNNQRMVDLLKLPEREQAPIASFHPEWVNKLFIEEAFPVAIKEGTWSGETVVIDAEGKEIPMSQVMIAHKNLNGEVENFSTIMRDISDRHKLEQELQLSEALSRAAFEQAAVGIVEIDAKTGKYTRVNNYFCEMIGYSRTELEQLSFIDFTHPDDVAESQKSARQLHLGELESFTMEKRYVRKDGSFFWSATTVSLINLPEGKGQRCLAIIKDISDRKKAEAALKLSEVRAKAAFEQAAVGIGERNTKTDLITRVNEHLCQMTGYTQSELSKLSYEELTYHQDFLESKEYLQKLDNGEIDNFTLEKRYVRKDGSIFWAATTACLIDIPGKQTKSSLAIIKDISDRKIAEQALIESENKFRTLVSNIDGAVYRSDNTTECQFNYISPAIFQLTGYPPEDFTHGTRSYGSLVHPEDVEDAISKIRAAVKERQLFVLEYRIIHRNGEIRWVIERGKGLCNHEGKTQWLEGVIYDISDRKAMERQLEFTQYGLDHAADCFYCLDEDAKILQVNQAACDRTGYTKEELLGMTIHDLAPTCPKELTWQPHWEKLKRLQNYSFETVHQTASGEIFPIEVVCNYLEFDGRAYSFDLVRDITERRQAEKALIRQQNHLAALLDNIPHIAWIKDEQSRFIAVNQPFVRACGNLLEDIVGKTDYDVWSAELAQKYREDDFEVLSSGARKVVEERVLLADGTEGWLETIKTPFKNASGDFAGTVGIAADLTERKQAELALAESETKFRTLVENAKDIIFSMTTEGIFTYVSPQVEQILGYPAEQLIGQDCLLFSHPDDIPQVTDCLKTAVGQGISVAGKRIRMPHINGGWRWIVFNNTPIKDVSGQIVSIQGIGRDVTETEQKEQALTAIVEGTAAKTGADFYRSCVRYLAEIFQVKHGFVTEFDRESLLEATMLVLWNGKEFTDPYIMGLAATPCLETRKQGIYIARDSLNELFPDANKYVLLTMESYASVTIVNSQGQAIGNLGIMDSKPLPYDTSTIEFILKLFATRVGAEMERQKNEDALRKSQAQLQAFIDNSPSAIFQKDLQGGYQLLNQTIAKLYNLDRDTLVNLTDFELFPEDIARKLRENDFEVINSKQSSTLEEVILHPDGTLHTYIANKFPLLDEQGKPYAIGGVSTDITDLKQAELALKESQAQFQRMTENVPGMIFRYIVHPDGNNEFTYVSSQIQEIYEVEPETALQNIDSMWARIHLDDISRISKDIEISAETLQPFTSTYRLILPNKGLRWVQNMSRPERLDNGDVVWDGITVDISDRKLAEAKQQRQLEILETTSDFVGTTDSQGNILYLNESWRNLLQKGGDKSCIRKVIGEQHPSWALEIVLNQAFPQATQQGMWSGETAILDANDREIPVSQVVIAHKSKNGKVEYFSTIIRDISDRKRAEAQLKIISDRLEIAIQSANIGIWEWDFQSDRLSWNERMFTIYGVQPQDFQGTHQDWSKHVHPDDLDSALIQPELLENRNSLTQEFRIVRTDGEVRYIFSTASIQKNQQGELVRAVGVNIDITERKLAEQKLQQTNEKLARATRMKDEFLANMSHELRTPLNAILGMAEGLQEGIFGTMNQEQNKALDTIENSGSHLLELIDEILDLTKIESGRVELEYSAVEVNHLCQSSLEFIKQQAQKKLIQLHLNTPFNLPKIRVDERRIRQVLINLLSNAVKFTPESGSVTLELTMLSPEKTIDCPYLRFVVKDTGIGIADKDLEKLFQPFTQIDSSLNRQYAGTGLGLFLVKRIIELHQGRVKVSSEVGVGSCFAIELPYSTVPTNDITNELKTSSFSNPNQQQEIALTAPIILLAEDNSTNSSIISTYLHSKGYRLQIAHDGLSAIELAVANQPDLILMDIQMPGMDGLTAIKHIRQNVTLTQIPIIALTAFAMEDDRRKCLAAGANIYLSKPVRLKKLFQSIQKLLNTNYRKHPTF